MSPTAKVGGVDDPIWDEPASPRTQGRQPRNRIRTTIIVVAVILVTGAAVTWFVTPRTPSSGDPGGQVMNQLTPAVGSLPGYGTAALPWVSQLPASLDASYIIKMEPRQDSCDGMAGTQGWSQAVVQSRFQWDQGLPALVAYMEPRLTQLGWNSLPQPRPSNPPGHSWNKTLSNGTRAYLDVSEEGGMTSPVWQLTAIGQPVGKSASGC